MGILKNSMRIHALALCAIVLATASCSSSRKVLTTATHTGANVQMAVTTLRADLKLIGKKISYYMPVSEAVSRGGKENVIAAAIKEALDANGGDVMVGLETVLSYREDGQIESVVVTGYPAFYTNFRNDDSIPPALSGSGQGDSDKQGGFLKIK